MPKFFLKKKIIPKIYPCKQACFWFWWRKLEEMKIEKK